jgi:hypothetical protein
MFLTPKDLAERLNLREWWGEQTKLAVISNVLLWKEILLTIFIGSNPKKNEDLTSQHGGSLNSNLWSWCSCYVEKTCGCRELEFKMNSQSEDRPKT